MIRLRRSARYLLVAIAGGALVATIGTGPRSPVAVRAVQPDVYQATAASASIDTRSYQTGSPVDPAPAINTATPFASLTADNSPRTEAHAAYAEPPALAQAATGLNNVPVPYASQAEALCANCATPVIQNADGNGDVVLNGSRTEAGAGVAHAEAAPLVATSHASDGRLRIGADDQLKNLYDAAIGDIYAQLNKPAPSPAPPSPPPPLNSPPPCATLTAPGAPSPLSVCPAALPLVQTAVQTGASDALTTITTSDQGTVLDTVSSIAGTQLLDGLITIGTIRTEVRATGDGSDAHSKVTALNDIQRVCVLNDCSFSITAGGICKAGDSLQACANDPFNQQLRQEGINVCRLGTASAGEGTPLVTGTAAGVLVEFHALADSKNNITPDPGYYKGFQGDCAAGAPVPRSDFAGGVSSYNIIGESSAQLFTRVFPTCSACSATTTDVGAAGSTDTSLVISGAPAIPGVTTVTSPGGAPASVVKKPAQNGAANAGAIVQLSPGHDRRPLLLAAFAAFELVLLLNLTAIARSRRRVGA